MNTDKAAPPAGGQVQLPTSGGRSRSPFRTRFRNRMTAGLVLVLPIWITLLLAGFVFGVMRDASLWLIEGLLISPWIGEALVRLGVSEAQIRAHGVEALPTAMRWVLGFVSVVLTVCMIYVLGMVTTNIVGRRAVTAVEGFFDRVPFVKTIYRASKQVLETFAGESARTFQRVVMVPVPSREVRTFGFVTQVQRDRATGEETCAVFVATAPNPTTGLVVVVRRKDLVELDWSVEDAIKVVMSGGVLMPNLPGRSGDAGRAPGTG